MTHLKIVSFTDRGAALGARLAALLPDVLTERYDRAGDPSLRQTFLSRFAQQAMVDSGGIVFIGAAGIAVRAVAPYLAGKSLDPAVLVVDEGGRFVIPLLSGHLGGANALAERIAALLGAVPIITTATDGRGAFAVDTWAKEKGLAVYDPENIKWISAALLRGETVGLASAFPVEGRLPRGVSLSGPAQCGFAIGFDLAAKPFPHTLHLVPRIVHLGVGCRRGVDRARIEAVCAEALRAAGAPLLAVAGVHSVDRKRDEAGLLHFCDGLGLPFTVYTAAQLSAVSGTFSTSAFVKETVGADNVCERAAVKGAGGGALICRKTARDGVTTAVAVSDWRVSF